MCCVHKARSRFRTLLYRVTSEALRRLQPGDFLLLCFAPPMPPRLKKLCLGVARLELPFRHGLGFRPVRLSGLRPQRLWGAGLQAGIVVARLEIQRLRASGMSSGYPFRPKQVWQLQPTASFGTPSLTPPWAQRGCPRPAHRAQRRTGRRQWERKGSASAAFHAGTAATLLQAPAELDPITLCLPDAIEPHPEDAPCPQWKLQMSWSTHCNRVLAKMWSRTTAARMEMRTLVQ